MLHTIVYGRHVDQNSRVFVNAPLSSRMAQLFPAGRGLSRQGKKERILPRHERLLLARKHS